MKKIIAITFALALFAVSVQAQSFIPRTGMGNMVNVDNTYRVLTQRTDTLTADAAGLDTVYYSPVNFSNRIHIDHLVDSVAIDITTPTLYNYDGDELELDIRNTSTGKCIKFAGGNISPATTTTGGAVGTLYLTASKYAIIKFRFIVNSATGTGKWVEIARMAQ